MRPVRTSFLPTFSAAILALLLVPSSGRADIVHESSTREPGDATGGFILGGGSGYVQGSRFHLDDTTEIQFGGARVKPSYGDPDTVRVSIVALQGNGLPGGAPSSMTTLVTATAPSPADDLDLLVPLSITLPPGDYGIVLSNDDPNSNSTILPFDNVNNPGASYFSGTSGGWSDGNGAVPGFDARFVLYNGCGDDVLAADETCDDGNRIDGDGCDSFCRDICGDAVVGANEECDDGNTAVGDCCDSGCTLPTVASCVVAGGGSLIVTDTTPDDKDKLSWKWQKGGAVDIANFGSPDTATSLLLCVDQDRGGDAARTIGSISMSPNVAWTGGDKNWKLKDKTGAAGLGGISGGTLKPGAAGKSSIGLKGSGTLLPSLAIGGTDSVTVTLWASNGQCWTSGAMPVTKATETKTTVKLP